MVIYLAEKISGTVKLHSLNTFLAMPRVAGSCKILGSRVKFSNHEMVFLGGVKTRKTFCFFSRAIIFCFRGSFCDLEESSVL